MTIQPRTGQNTQWCSTRRPGQNIQPANKLEKLIKYIQPTNKSEKLIK